MTTLLPNVPIILKTEPQPPGTLRAYTGIVLTSLLWTATKILKTLNTPYVSPQKAQNSRINFSLCLSNRFGRQHLWAKMDYVELSFTGRSDRQQLASLVSTFLSEITALSNSHHPIKIAYEHTWSNPWKNGAIQTECLRARSVQGTSLCYVSYLYLSGIFIRRFSMLWHHVVNWYILTLQRNLPLLSSK